MKRLRDGTSNRVALEDKRGILREMIKSLTAQGPNVDKSHGHAQIGTRNKQREEVYLRNLHHWLTMGQTKRIEHHSIEREGHENGCSSELNERVERLEKQFQELTQQCKSRHGLAVYDQAESTTLPLPPETKLVGDKFEQNALKIIEWLKNSKSFISIGIYGMGGVGKSALVTHLCHQLQQDTAFSWPIYWLTASQYDSIYKLQEGIAKLIGMDFLGEEDERKRATKLQRRLAKMGNIVLVLDDMPQPFSLYEVGIPLKESCCKIMLTTRSLEVCRKMGCGGFIIKVETLSDDERLTLLVDNLKNYRSLPEDIKHIINFIPDQCHGLPLAITTMAHHMAGVVDYDELENDRHKLSCHAQDAMRNCVLPNLKRSYDRLKNITVQNCFLSSVIQISSVISMSPSRRSLHRYKIRPSDLVHYWIDEGSLDMMRSREFQLSKGHSILDIVLNSCLLEKDLDDGTYVTMHDLIRDMGIQIIQEHPHIMYKASSELTKMPEKELWMEDLVKVSLAWNHIGKIPSDMSPKCLNLTVLILCGNPLTEIPESFFLGMMGLRVLDLSNTSIERLPNSVSDLENLRELLLGRCSRLAHMPPLEKLLKLRVLDLKFVFEIKEAPRGMERLRCLEKLNFNWHESDLTYFNTVVEDWLIFRMRKISYSLVISGSQPWPPYGYSHPSERKMMIQGVEFGQMKEDLILPSEIQLLEISSCTGLKHISSSIRHQPFISLKLETIETLILRALPDLSCIIESPPPAVPLSKLKHLEIEWCPKIRIVFPFNLVQRGLRHSSLEEIKIIKCEGLEEIFESGTSETNIGILDLPNLKSFEVRAAPNLRSIWMGPLQCNSLKHLRIDGPCEMKEVFSLNVSECRQSLLPNLETIKVQFCDRLEVVFATTNSGTNPILSLPKLRKLTLSGLPKLSSIYRGLLICTTLKEIHISGCRDLRLFQLSKPLICDAASSTLGSIRKYDAESGLWEPLSGEHPEDMHSVRASVDEYWRSEPSLASTSGTINAHQMGAQDFLIVILPETEGNRSEIEDANLVNPWPESNLVHYEGLSHGTEYEWNSPWGSHHQQFNH